MTRKGEVPRGIVPPSCFPLGNSTSCFPFASVPRRLQRRRSPRPRVFSKNTDVFCIRRPVTGRHRGNKGKHSTAFFERSSSRDFSAAAG